MKDIQLYENLSVSVVISPNPSNALYSKVSVDIGSFKGDFFMKIDDCSRDFFDIESQ